MSRYSDDVEQLLAKLPKLDQEQKDIVARAAMRSAELAREYLESDEDRRVQIRNEGLALRATLLTIGEEQAARASAVILDTLQQIVNRAVRAALGV